ncbi:SusC/RagA family TonB-linked outer membrane protein [Reichenbachiella sp. MALMAid0571]
MSKYGLLGLFIQCLLFNVITAANTSAQKSIEDVILTIEFKGQKVEKIFSEIEENTDFNFSYQKSITRGKNVGSTLLKSKSLGYVLRHISKETDLQFRRVDNSIFVKDGKDSKDWNAIEDNIKISGKVTSDKGESLPGVSVVIKGTTTGTITDLDGNYSFNAPDDCILVYSFVGFKPQDVPVNGRSTIDLVMETDATELDEVVVTALGVEKNVKAIGYSIETLDGEEISKSSTFNVLGALNGKVAGVQIGDGNGVQGGTTRITIRGNNSLLNGRNQPLIIVDGVAIDNDIAGTDNATSLTGNESGKDWGSGINQINPQDIESINILKGANAAALYGVRGGNGVILITTKRGKKGEGIGIDVSMTNMAIETFMFRDVQNRFGQGATTAGEPTFPQDDEGNNLLPAVSYWGSGASWGPEMLGQDVLWWDGVVRPFSPQPDNVKDFFQKGSNKIYNIAFSGASDLGNMRVSITNNKTTPVTPNTEREQTTFSLNSSLNVSSKLRADVVLSYSQSEQLNSPTLGSSEASIGKNLTYNWPRSYRIDLERDSYKLPDGTRAPAGIGYPANNASSGNLGRTGSFFWDLNENNQTRLRNRLIGSIVLNYDVNDWINVNAKVGLDNYNDDRMSKNTPWDALGLQRGFYQRYLGQSRIENHQVMASATRNITPDIIAKLSVGGEYYSQNFQSIQGQSGNANRGFADPYLFTFSNINYALSADGRPPLNFVNNNIVPKEGVNRKEIQSLFSFLDLSYKDFLFLQGTFRNDWSSTLSTSQSPFNYFSVSGNFNFTDAIETIPDAISFGKLRLAYAQSANDALPYSTNATYEKGTFGGAITAKVKGSIPTQEIKPERVNSFEAGLNLSFLKDKIRFDGTYYSIVSTDQFVNSPVPLSSGFSTLKINTAELTNEGFELIISATPIRTTNFTWDVSFNMGSNKNYVTRLDDNGDAEVLRLGGIFGNNGPAIEARKGEQIGAIVGWDYVYFDENGNGETDGSEKRPENRIIDEDGEWYDLTEERVILGNATPDWTGGFSSTLSWKGFTLNTLMDIKMGGDVFFGSYATSVSFGQAPETLVGRNAELGGLAWTDDENVTHNNGLLKPGVYADGTPNDKVVPYWYTHLDMFNWGPTSGPVSPSIYEASWVRLRELSLSYNLPQEILSKTGFIKNGSITLIGRDLWFLYNTAPDNLNPSAINGSGISQGIEWGQLPTARSYGFNIKLSF